MERSARDTFAVARRLVELVREGDRETPYEDLYAPGIVSVEPALGIAVPWGPHETDRSILGPRVSEGIEAVLAKGDRWEAAFETHRMGVEETFVDGDKFAIVYSLDLTNRGTGERATVRELALYTVEGGRIVREEFFSGG